MTKNISIRAWSLRGILLLVCIFVITGGYYLFHKPITPEIILAVVMDFWRVIAVLIIVSLAGAIGCKFRVSLPGFTLGSLVMQSSLGLGIIAVLVLLLGSVVGLNWVTLAGLPLVTGIVLWKSMRDWVLDLGLVIKNNWFQTSGFEKTIGVFLGVILLSALLLALAPPVKYDALMYHLVLPQQYLADGRISHIPWLVMTGMPQTTEMLYTLTAGWAGLPAAAVLGWAIGVLAILGIIGFFESENVRISRAGWVAAASLLAGETFASSLFWAYVDWTSLLFGICALYGLRIWMKTANLKSIFLAGLFAGLSFATKYTGGILVVCCLVVVLNQLVSIYSIEKKFDFRTLLTFSAAALVFPLVWLLRNLFLTGNPFYPFFFPAAEMDAVRIAVYQGAQTFGNWWEGLALPIRATIWGLESGEGYSVSIGPLMLALSLGNLVISSALSDEHKSMLKLALVMVLSGWVFWAVGNLFSGYLIQTRMYYSIFPALAVLAGLGWLSLSGLRIGRARLSRVVGAVVLLALGLSTIHITLKTIQSDAMRVLSGSISEEKYQDGILGWYAPAMRKVSSLAENGGRTLFFYEPRGLACVPGCDPDEILDQWKISRNDNPETENVLNLWKDEGFQYVLLNLDGMAFLEEGTDAHHPPEEVNALREIVKVLPVIETFGKSYIIYKLP